MRLNVNLIRDQIKQQSWLALVDERSQPIMDEQIAEEWIQANPELYALGRDFANSVTEAWNRLRKILNRLLIRRHEYPMPEWKSPIVSRCGKDIGIYSSSNTGSPFSGEYSFLSCQNIQSIRWHQPHSTESPFRINGFPVTQYIGRHTRHDWGEKFECLDDAVSDYNILLRMGKSCYIALSGDSEFPYLIVVPEFYSPKPTIH
jgi:hypothetical protein